MKIDELERELKQVTTEEEVILTRFNGMNAQDLLKSPLYSTSDTFRRDADHYLKVFSHVDSIHKTIEAYRRARKKLRYHLNLITEGDVTEISSGAVESAAVDVVENLVDMSGGHFEDSVVGKSVQLPTSLDLEMAGFMNRPIEIVAQQLALDADVDLRFDVWKLYLADPTIRSKLRNYAFMRFDLNLRVIVSGTPFHYGRLLVSYQPYVAANSVLPVFGVGNRIPRLKYYSQAPGAVTMDIRENVPMDIVIPYVAPQPMGRLFNDSETVLSSSDNFNDFTELGSLFVSTLNRIKSISLDATQVFIYIYAHATNVKLHGATGTHIDIQTEGKVDERVIGPVERVSSSMASVAGALTQVPIIAPFASAANIALGALSKISSIFGWSYPVMVDKPVRMRNDPYQNGAQTIGLDTGKKITLDPLQEITVDPRVVGVEEDEMTIASICCRESLLDQFSWNHDSTAEVPLWAAYVTPRANKVDVIGAGLAVQPTALSFAATPFSYWHGDITYRFDVVTSNFHRGKLMIIYEPNARQYDLIQTSVKLNKQHICVVDLQETQSVSVTVKWNFSRTWARNLADSNMFTSIKGAGAFEIYSDATYATNGVIYVVPLTTLQSPDSSDVQVNVFVRSDNMKFNRLTDEFLPHDRSPYGVGALRTEGDISNKTCSDMSINQELFDDSKICVTNFGEAPVSFRALLKRFMQGIVTGLGATDSGTNSVIFPIYPGDYYDPDTFTGSELDVASSVGLYNYLRWAFMAQRGGMRKRIFVRNSVVDAWKGPILDLRYIVKLDNDSTVTTQTNATVDSGEIDLVPDGTVQFLNSVNGGVEVELPFYSNNQFAFAFNPDPFYNASAVDPRSLRNYIVVTTGPAPTRPSFAESFAIADDFSFMRWVGAYPYTLRV